MSKTEKQTPVKPLNILFYVFGNNNHLEPLRLKKDLNISSDLSPDLTIWQETLNLIKDILARKTDFEFQFPQTQGASLNSSNQEVILLLTTTANLASKDCLDHLAEFMPITDEIKNYLPEECLTMLTSQEQKSIRPVNLPRFNYQPMITIGYEDFLNIYTDTSSNEQRLRSLKLDSRAKFLDSSIWHRYIPIIPSHDTEPTKTGDSFTERFEDVLDQILQCHQDELYRTNVARSSLEFQLRMLRNSFIIEMGERGHNEAVTPFKFHSETIMQKEAQKAADFFKKHKLTDLKWQFLLVDDYADAGLSVENYESINLSKKSLIEKLLKNTGVSIQIDYPRDEKQGSATHKIIAKCIDMMSEEKRYDILLLDYLLAWKTTSSESQEGISEREYGYEFLKQLEQQAHKIKRGPYLRHWIFPISSFPFAMYDKLRQIGTDNHHHLWHLSSGGDPITTPQLFRYYLLSFMKDMVGEVLLTDENLADYLRVYDGISKDQDWCQIIRGRLENLESKIFILHNTEEHSLFSHSIYNNINKPGGFRRFLKDLSKGLDLFRKVLKDSYNLDEFEKFWGFDRLSNSDNNSIKERYNEAFSSTLAIIEKRIFNTVYFPSKIIESRIKVLSNSQYTFRANFNEDLYFLPENIQDLQEVLELKLNGHKLYSLPNEIKKLKQLSILDLSNNNFKEIPIVLKDLPQLEELNLTDNPLPIEVGSLHPNTKKDVVELIKKGNLFSLIIKEAIRLNYRGEIENAIEKIKPVVQSIRKNDSTFSTLLSNVKRIENEQVAGIILSKDFFSQRMELKERLSTYLSALEEEWLDNF